MMRYALVLLVLVHTVWGVSAAELSAHDLVAQLYQAHRSKHDPLDETQLLGRYFDAALLKLYLNDKREGKGEVGRLDGDPLYNAQDIEIKNLSVSAPETSAGETRVTVRFHQHRQSDARHLRAHPNCGWLANQRYPLRRRLIAEKNPSRQNVTSF